MKKDPITAGNRRFNPWPAGIIASFVIFISGAAVFITWAVGQSMDLVRKDYYDHEILFQQRIDELRRTEPFRSQISVTYKPLKRRVIVTLPRSHALAGLTGRIHVYRPSDASLDREVTLDAAGCQEIDAKNWPDGLWKLQISWEVNEDKYYCEQPLLIGSSTM